MTWREEKKCFNFVTILARNPEWGRAGLWPTFERFNSGARKSFVLKMAFLSALLIISWMFFFLSSSLQNGKCEISVTKKRQQNRERNSLGPEFETPNPEPWPATPPKNHLWIWNLFPSPSVPPRASSGPKTKQLHQQPTVRSVLTLLRFFS